MKISEFTFELPQELMWLNETEGLSVPKGISGSGSISNFVFSAKLFLDTIDGNSRVIKEAYDQKNIRLFTIKVHALRVSARIIGATELAELARKMEDAGEHQDTEYIDDNIDRLLTEYGAFKEKLSRLGSKDKTQ